MTRLRIKYELWKKKKEGVERYITNREFYTYGSVHRIAILMSSNNMQQHAGIYLFQNDSLRGLLEKYPTVFFYANTWWIII